MAGNRAGKHFSNRLADMSLPAEERGRRRSTRTSRKPLPAQVGRGNTPAGRRRARDGERKMRQERGGLTARDR